MAQNILKQKEEKKDKKEKKSKNKKVKKKKSSSTSSSEDSSEEPDLSPEEVQLQLGIRPKDTKLGGKILRYEDMSPEAWWNNNKCFFGEPMNHPKKYMTRKSTRSKGVSVSQGSQVYCPPSLLYCHLLPCWVLT